MYPINIQLRLHPSEKFFPTDKEYKPIDVSPVYYKIEKDTYAYIGKRYLRVTYQIYFAENGAIGLNGINMYNTKFGYHPKDIERIISLHDLTTYQPKFIFFSAHSQEGKWYKTEDCLFENNRLVVYSALNSHALHPKQGTIWRLLGFANDYCSNYGPHINLTLLEDNSINYFAQNEEVINTPFKRFLLPFYQNKIPEMKKKQSDDEAKINKGI